MKRHSSLRSGKAWGAQTLAAFLPLGGVSSFFLIGLGLLILLFSAISPNNVSDIRMSITDAASPILATITKPIIFTADAVRNASGLGDLQAENIRLKQENLRLKEWYQTALLLESENKSLRDLLNVKAEAHYKTITARTLADAGNAFAKTVLISAGAQDGVKKNQAVVSGEGLIGRVVEVGSETARVLLITDINSRVPVLVEDTRQHAILAGSNADMTRLLHLPPDSDIKDNARIITSGHGGLFPHGLAIGRITRSKDGAVEVNPFANFDRIVHVRVLDKSQDPNLVAAGQHKSLSVLQ